MKPICFPTTLSCLILLLLSTVSGQQIDQELVPRNQVMCRGVVAPTPTDNERVAELFKLMRTRTYKSNKFPKLTYADIPALLERCESEEELVAFPRNMLSSQFEATCREGIVAMWLIEGIRKGGRYPSLNALCLPKLTDGDRDWTQLSNDCQPRLVIAYKEWWKKAKELSEKEASQLEPLSGTDLNWH